MVAVLLFGHLRQFYITDINRRQLLHQIGHLVDRMLSLCEWLITEKALAKIGEESLRNLDALVLRLKKELRYPASTTAGS